MKPPFRVPRATYRVQLHAQFTFEHLARIIPYLADLGISDVYASPIFRASPGSTHGYDVCDHNEINPELGGIDGLMKVSALLQEREMGLLVDFVPNHMGIEGPFNWRWIDVLEHGLQSRFAAFFDIQWNPHQASLHDRILVPMLHDFYGRVLDAGEIQLRYEEAAFWVCYRTLRFPLRPRSYRTILQRLAWFKNPDSVLARKLENLGERFCELPKPESSETIENTQERNRQRDSLRRELARLIETEQLGPDLEHVLHALNGEAGHAASFDNLHEILEEQNYRLAYWKSGTHEINYRRFFAIDTLVGLHMELQEVFDDSHRLLQYLIEKGVVTGVRVDHIDGLWDPAHYLQRLSNLGRHEEPPVYLLVEKILTEEELLPVDWAVHGTTGYDFAGSLVNLLIDGRAEPAFTRLYRDFAGMTLDPHEQAYELKLFIMEDLFPNAIDSLALDLEAQVKSDRRWRDWTVNDLRLAISRIIACLSVYRTYRRAGHKPSLADIAVVEKAVSATLRRNHSSDPAPFLFVRDIWTALYPDAVAGAAMKVWADAWVCKLQQYTGAIMAKSVEDTFFYRYVRLFGANEVGHHPAEFGRDVAAFHKDNLTRLQFWPASMLSTSTHDTKVAEDVRSRLLALSEIPAAWAEALGRWSESNRSFKTQVGEVLAPDGNEEYLLYQILLGAWPLEEEKVDEVFRNRIKDYMRKAMAESKANTTWSSPNQPWVKACEDFIDAILDREQAATFQADFVPFAQDLAWRGMNGSLVQVALKLTVPGMPDFYQGTELWDLSLVDPDNRRPVDYDARMSAMPTLDPAPFPELLASWRDGRVKMRLIQTLLRYRKEHPGLFAQGSYAPVALSGAQPDAFVAFTRQDGAEQILVIAARRFGEKGVTDLRSVCAGSTLTAPAGVTRWHELLTSREVAGGSEPLAVDAILDGAPVAVLRALPEA